MPAAQSPLVVALEAPVNPNIYVLHVRRHLTDEMAEKYNRTTMTRAPSWVQPFFGFQPISDVHVMRHRLRFRTFKKDYDWSLFGDYLLQRTAPEVFGALQVIPLPAGPLRRQNIARTPISFTMRGAIPAARHVLRRPCCRESWDPNRRARPRGSRPRCRPIR